MILEVTDFWTSFYSPERLGFAMYNWVRYFGDNYSRPGDFKKFLHGEFGPYAVGSMSF